MVEIKAFNSQNPNFTSWYCFELRIPLLCIKRRILAHIPRRCHSMETFPAILAICDGESTGNRSPMDSPYNALMFSLVLAQTNCSLNNRMAGSIRRHDTVMFYIINSHESTDWFICLNLRYLYSYRHLHNDVMKWKHFQRHWPLWGEITGHR